MKGAGMVGSRKIASLLADWRPYEGDYPAEPPENFCQVGGPGSTRIAVRHNSFPDVVYKCAIDPWYVTTNAQERKLITKAQRLPIEGLTVPRATLYNLSEVNILAMEYVEGIPYFCFGNAGYCQCPDTCLADLVDKARDIWGVGDLHMNNVMQRTDGSFVVIDLGESASVDYDYA